MAAQHSFAAEILTFYVQVAGFQERLYQRIARSSANSSSGGPSTGSGQAPPAVESATRRLLSVKNVVATHPILLEAFPKFLSLIEQNAPARLQQVAHDLRHAGSRSLTDLLTRSWSDTDFPTEPQEFLALAFLQPYAEFIRSQAQLQLEGYNSSFCPLCNRQPVCSILRPLGDGGRRNLFCGFCLTEWEFRRIVCPGCGQEDNAKLPVYTAEAFPHIRVECCDACQTYIKSIDMTKAGLAEPIVDELAAIPLDLWAQERGYRKLRPNLLGM